VQLLGERPKVSWREHVCDPQIRVPAERLAACDKLKPVHGRRDLFSKDSHPGPKNVEGETLPASDPPGSVGVPSKECRVFGDPEFGGLKVVGACERDKVVRQILQKGSLSEAEGGVLRGFLSPVHFIRRLGEDGRGGSGFEGDIHLQSITTQDTARGIGNLDSLSIISSFSQASGIIIATACGSERPARHRSSKTLSKVAESLWSGSTTGTIFCMFSPKSGDSRRLSRERIQLMLPLKVLTSPLCAT
jgi:hypothetical protein